MAGFSDNFDYGRRSSNLSANWAEDNDNYAQVAAACGTNGATGSGVWIRYDRLLRQ